LRRRRGGNVDARPLRRRARRALARFPAAIRAAGKSAQTAADWLCGVKIGGAFALCPRTKREFFCGIGAIRAVYFWRPPRGVFYPVRKFWFFTENPRESVGEGG